MEDELDDEREKRLHAEAETRGAQAALVAEEALRRTEQANVVRLGEEVRRLSLVTDGLMEERNQLVSVIFDGAGGQLLAQQEDQPGMYLRERLGFEKMKLKQMEREVENAKAWGNKHYVANETLRKRVSSSKKELFCFIFYAMLGGIALNLIVLPVCFGLLQD